MDILNSPETTEQNVDAQQDDAGDNQYIKFQENTRSEEEQAKVHDLYQNLKKKLMKVYKQRKGDKVSLCPQMLR